MKHLFITVLLIQLVCAYGLTLDTGFSNSIDIGPNVYTVGYNLLIPTVMASFERYYSISITDNPRTVIQKAITDINSKGGGTVYIREGTYLMNNNLETYNNLRVTGDGIDRTILKVIDNSPSFTAASLIHCKNDRNVVIANMTLDGNKKNQVSTPNHGFWSEFCDYQWIDTVKAVNFQKIGIFAHGSNKLNNMYTTITNSIASNNDIDGFSTDYTRMVTVDGCLADANGRHGFMAIINATYTTVSNSQFSNNGYTHNSTGCGFMVENDNVGLLVPTITANNNVVLANKKGGMCLDASSGLRLNNNDVKDSQHCFMFNRAVKSELYDNICYAPILYKNLTTPVTTILASYLANPNKQVYIDATNRFTSSVSSPDPHPPVDNIGYSERIVIGPNVYTIGYDIDTEVISPTVQNFRIDPTDNARMFIQNVIATITNNGGGKIILREGTYIMDWYLVLQSKLQIDGAGIDKTIIKLGNWSKSFDNSGMLRVRSGNNIILSNFTIDGNKEFQFADPDGTVTNEISYGRYGIFTEGCTDLWFDYIKIQNMQAYGFDPHGWKSQMIYGNYLTITNCIAAENDWDGFTLDQTLNIVIVNSQAIHNGRHGYNIVTGSKHVVVSNNYAYNNGYYYPHTGTGCGYMFQNNQLFGTDDIIVTHNYAENSRKAGMCIDDIHDMKFTDNIIVNSPYCFNLVDTTNTLILNSTCNTARVYKLDGTIVATTLSTYDSNTMVYYGPDNKYTYKPFV